MKTRRSLSVRRAQRRSSKTTARMRVGGAWYTREQWAAVWEVAIDPDNLEASYEDWVAMAERARQKLAQTGLRLEKVMINSQVLRAWCQRENRPVDAEARAAFAAELLRQPEEQEEMRDKLQPLDPSSPPLFIVYNHHGPDARVPPTFTGDDPRVYQSYFENFSGEQAVFVYNRNTQQAVLWCGDAGWQPYAVRDGRVEGLLLSAAEQLWLQACWQAVTGPKSR